ncbi:DUF1304 domain-containing protein [Poritiphilus flavus]|uniref:DUF1304 family protein n=1 Tax=Poritiphilus flavus TaxID=2697053 RepID=A0A6L9ED80_9FLAO|nr:DUF1304 domain-containing protein [Poritiphilus flavus]NAS12508.1 DUF1304 family protein [Poritiphilus flavus]
MKIAAQILIGVIALLHLYFLWFEMFAWTTRGRKVFRSFPPELFEPTKPMAANQGLYNGFLAAGLIWTFFIDDATWQQNIAIFFLSCVLIAGLYGAYSASKKIFFVQGLPALLALAILLLK